MACRLTLALLVCASLSMVHGRSALAQDQFNNNTAGDRPSSDDQFNNDSQPEERDGWEFTEDPNPPYHQGQQVWCHANPEYHYPGGQPGNSPVICLEPGQKPPYMLHAEQNGRQAPDAPFDPYAPNAPLQPVSPQSPQRASPRQPPRMAGRAGQTQINGATSSYAVLAGASALGNCQLKGTQLVGTPNGASETLYICLGPDHFDGQTISGSIRSVDGRSRYYKSITGTFRAGPGGRQPTFEISLLNGNRPKGRIMTVSLR